MSDITLFVPYFEPPEPERRREVDAALAENLAHPAIGHVVLMADEPVTAALDPARATVAALPARPTYRDWARLSLERCPDGLSVLANADIHFDGSLPALGAIFEADAEAFVALSRYDPGSDGLVPHPNPHWSQDVWAFRPGAAPNPHRDAALDFPLGVPRCDNKVAYVFAMHGHRVHNPFFEVRAIHLHASQLRGYAKRGDRRIVGGMAMVHPSSAPATPSRLDIEVWPVRTTGLEGPRLNPTLERWSAADAASMRDEASLVIEGCVAGHDSDWQRPAITEAHAFNRMRLFGGRSDNSAYLGFPWATLVDFLVHNERAGQGTIVRLAAALDRVADALPPGGRRHTVCQHIHLTRIASYLARAGVTDVWWSHAIRGRTRMPELPGIRIHPFPLYPVQLPRKVLSLEDRLHLYSFVGAKGTAKYLSGSRRWIAELLSDDPRGCVREREGWHYQRAVYDGHVLSKAREADGLLTDAAAGDEFREVMAQSLFALCPSGTGPNSIRLWEAISGGTIPVVLSDGYLPPGPESAFHAATVTCAESREAIAELPGRLATMARDDAEIARRRAALRLLAARYGRATFVSDILAAC